MAFLNLQTQTPKLNITNIKSPIGKLGNSISKIPFGGVAKAIGSQPKPLQIGNIDAPSEPSALYGVVEALQADVQALRQEQVETAEILNDIGNALATDFANRISEEKAQNTLLNKQRSKLRQRTKEENLEKTTSRKTLGVKSGGIGLPKVGGGIFGKLIQFFTTVAAGIALTNIFEWLADDGNRKKLKDTFKAVTDHWKWIVGAAGALVVADLGLKLAGIASVLGIFTPLLSNPFFWAGAGIIMAAAHQGLGANEKETMKDLNLMVGGPTEENRKILAAKYQKIIDETMPLGSKGALFGDRGKLEQRIKFLESGMFGGHGSEKKMDWSVMENSGEVKIDKKATGGQSAGWTLVGERGPELLKLPLNSHIVPNHSIGNLALNNNNMIVINNPPIEIEGDPPQLSEPTHTATNIDLVSSVNPLNPYMIEIPEMFCISV